jgi:hypothetical protein
MKGEIFDSANQPSGLEGYKAYMSWVKSQVIAGKVVSIGILCNGGSDPIYDHEVTVMKIGTNHDPTDSTYYDDDVVFFDDHGGVAVILSPRNDFDQFYPFQPSIPPGAADDSTCTPYQFGYTFGDFVSTRLKANDPSSNAYSIIFPDGNITVTQGADGYQSQVPTRGHNTGFAISGPIDVDENEFLPVSLSIIGSWTSGIKNPRDPFTGYNYENPMIGNGTSGYILGNACSNTQPLAMQIEIEVLVSNLLPGEGYYMYEYRFPSVHGVGDAAALAIPKPDVAMGCTPDFHCVFFRASSHIFRTTVMRSSMEVLVYRVIRADQAYVDSSISFNKDIYDAAIVATVVSATIVIAALLLRTRRAPLPSFKAFFSGYTSVPEQSLYALNSQDVCNQDNICGQL